MVAELSDPTIHLLANDDEYFVAYRDHGHSLHPLLRTDQANLDDVPSHHIFALNGHLIGGLQEEVVSIGTEWAVPLARSQYPALEAAAQRYGEFLGMTVSLEARS